MPDPPIMPRTDLVMPAPTFRCHHPRPVFGFEGTDAQALPKRSEGGREMTLSSPAVFIPPRRSLLDAPSSQGMTSAKTEGPCLGALRRQFRLGGGSVYRRPHFLLGEIHEARKHDQEDYDLEADALALHQVRLGCPHQEGRHVLGILIYRLWRAIVKGDLSWLEWRRHGDVVAREKLVVVPALRQLETLRRVLVPLQERGDVIGSLLLILRECIKDEPRETARVGACLGKC